jgi:hypothetical protein
VASLARDRQSLNKQFIASRRATAQAMCQRVGLQRQGAGSVLLLLPWPALHGYRSASRVLTQRRNPAFILV